VLDVCTMQLLDSMPVQVRRTIPSQWATWTTDKERQHMKRWTRMHNSLWATNNYRRRGDKTMTTTTSIVQLAPTTSVRTQSWTLTDSKHLTMNNWRHNTAARRRHDLWTFRGDSIGGRERRPESDPDPHWPPTRCSAYKLYTLSWFVYFGQRYWHKFVALWFTVISPNYLF